MYIFCTRCSVYGGTLCDQHVREVDCSMIVALSCDKKRNVINVMGPNKTRA